MATLFDVAHFCSWNGYAEDMRGYIGIDKASMTNEEFHFPFGANVTYGEKKKTRIQRICDMMFAGYVNLRQYELAKDYDPVMRVKQLLSLGAKPDIKDTDGWSALLQCCRNGWPGHKEIAEILIKAGADVNQIWNNSFGPLFLAARNNNMHMVKMLLENGADINLRADGGSPFDGACKGGSIEIAKFLVSKGAVVTDNSYEMAIDGGHIAMIKYLGTLRPAPAYSISYAITENKTPLINILAKYGGDVNYIDGERTLLETAVMCDKSYVYDLLKAGANPNITAVHNEFLPISMAIMDGNINMVKLLCQYSVDANLLHSFGDSLVTPIHMAIIYANSNQRKKEYMECLKEIVKKGSLRVRDSYGDTPLKAASSRENIEAVTIIQREFLARKFKK